MILLISSLKDKIFFMNKTIRQTEILYFCNMKYIDFHNHKQNSDNKIISVRNIRLEHDMELPEFDSPFSMGLHPYDIKHDTDINLLDKIKIDNNLFAIGECGFDKNISLPYEIQKPFFEKQITISENFNKPLIIHCVGYFNEIMDISKSTQHSQQWIIHGFSGHRQLAFQLIDSGFMLSFGASLFNDETKSVNAFKEIPAHSFFLETDESNKTIQEIYKRAAQLRNIKIENLKQNIFNNFKTLFKQ